VEATVPVQIATEELVTPEPVTDNTEAPENAPEPVLPETAGDSAMQLAVGAAALALGLGTAVLRRRRAEA